MGLLEPLDESGDSVLDSHLRVVPQGAPGLGDVCIGSPDVPRLLRKVLDLRPDLQCTGDQLDQSAEADCLRLSEVEDLVAWLRMLHPSHRAQHALHDVVHMSVIALG
jgi:hypothetical protein